MLLLRCIAPEYFMYAKVNEASPRPLLEDECKFYLRVELKLGEASNTRDLQNMILAAALCLRQSPHSTPPLSRAWLPH